MNTVKMSLTILLIAFALCSCAPLKGQKDTPEVQLPPGTLTAAEVTALFSGQTVESVLESNGRTSLTYYNPNHELRQLQYGEKRSGFWRVRDDGRICLQLGTEKEKCRIIVKEGPTYYKYTVKKNGMHERILAYTSFRQGNLVD